MDIRADGNVLEEPELWERTPLEMARQPFWVNDAGVHFIWVTYRLETGQMHLLVLSFDAETGELEATQIYDPYPPELGPGETGFIDAAGAPDGSFAAVIGHRDDADPYGHVQRVVLGNIEQSELTAVWQPPWSEAEAWIFHVGWDGEAFAIHSLDAQSAAYRLLRLAPDGTTVAGPLEVGRISSLWLGDSDFHTEAESGQSWLLGTMAPGVWLSGHDRGGVPLPGTEADGGVSFVAVGDGPCAGGSSSQLAVASSGQQALLGWSSFNLPAGRTCLQRVVDAVPTGEPIAIPGEEKAGVRRALARWQGSWWLGMLRAERGIEAFRLDDTDVLSQAPLIRYDGCSRTCWGDKTVLDVSSLNAATWQDQLWFGFWDNTDCWLDPQEHAEMVCPYRVVRVKEGCTYPTMYEVGSQR